MQVFYDRSFELNHFILWHVRSDLDTFFSFFVVCCELQLINNCLHECVWPVVSCDLNFTIAFTCAASIQNVLYTLSYNTSKPYFLVIYLVIVSPVSCLAYVQQKVASAGFLAQWTAYIQNLVFVSESCFKQQYCLLPTAIWNGIVQVTSYYYYYYSYYMHPSNKNNPAIAAVLSTCRFGL